MKIGLCLSGGGAKGAFQAGVIKGLYDNGISKFDL
jgi:predicted acylesterase/phospholipase RssA